jgi:hypothetical protein
VRLVANEGWGGSLRMRAAAAMVVGEVVRACGWWCSGVRWLELIVEVDCSGQSR